MASLEHFEVNEGYATFRPEGPITVADLLSLWQEALKVCRENAVTRLLIDHRKTTHASLTTVDRFRFSEGLAAFWDREIRLVLLCRPDQIDPERIGVVVAANRGLQVSVVDSEAEALRHLLA
jgi:hypothetical protein